MNKKIHEINLVHSSIDNKIKIICLNDHCSRLSKLLYYYDDYHVVESHALMIIPVRSYQMALILGNLNSL